MKSLTLLLYGLAVLVGYDPSVSKSHQMAAMEITWHFDEENFCCEITSPADGWIAIGLNEDREFVKSNLIMAALRDGKTVVEDQYISALGVHPKVDVLGGKSHITRAEVISIGGQSKLKLEMKAVPEDALHYRLQPNKRIYLTLAYSTHKDFNHHSTQRQSAWINL